MPFFFSFQVQKVWGKYWRPGCLGQVIDFRPHCFASRPFGRFALFRCRPSFQNWGVRSARFPVSRFFCEFPALRVWNDIRLRIKQGMFRTASSSFRYFSHWIRFCRELISRHKTAIRRIAMRRLFSDPAGLKLWWIITPCSPKPRREWPAEDFVSRGAILRADERNDRLCLFCGRKAL